MNSRKALNVGVAAHITAAAPGGPRYDPDLTEEDRRSASNGIWLCQTCGKLVDNDPVRYTADLLRAWKTIAEHRALHDIGKTDPEVARSIEDKWVNLKYPEQSGLSAELKEKGYTISWCRANDEATRVDIEGWEYVLVEDPDGRRSRLKIRDHPVIGGYLVLLKKRDTDSA